MTLARFCGVVALAVFVVNVTVHLSTFMPELYSSVDLRWLSSPLALLLFPVFLFMVLSLASRPRTPSKKTDGLFGKWAAVRKQKADDQARLLTLVPQSLRVLCGCFFAYAIINFISVSIQLRGLPMRSEDGTYYVRGTELSDLDRSQYLEYRAYRDRLETGHLMLFSVLPAAYFLVVHPRLHLLADQSELKHDVDRGTT
ncbi:MAG: hypothetical protein AAFU85_22465 [Planctomycetota bacterium]